MNSNEFKLAPMGAVIVGGGNSGSNSNDDTEKKRQQRAFNDCAAKANNAARWSALGNAGLQQLGTFIAGVGIAFSIFLGPHAGRAASSTLTVGTALNQAASIKEAGHPGPAIILLGAGTIGYAWKSQRQALQARNAAIAKCSRETPLADHSLGFLQS